MKRAVVKVNDLGGGMVAIDIDDQPLGVFRGDLTYDPTDGVTISGPDMAEMVDLLIEVGVLARND